MQRPSTAQKYAINLAKEVWSQDELLNGLIDPEPGRTKKRKLDDGKVELIKGKILINSVLLITLLTLHSVMNNTHSRHNINKTKHEISFLSVLIFFFTDPVFQHRWWKKFLSCENFIKFPRISCQQTVFLFRYGSHQTLFPVKKWRENLDALPKINQPNGNRPEEKNQEFGGWWYRGRWLWTCGLVLTFTLNFFTLYLNF